MIHHRRQRNFLRFRFITDGSIIIQRRNTCGEGAPLEKSRSFDVRKGACASMKSGIIWLLSNATGPNNMGYMYYSGVIAISVQSFYKDFFGVVSYLLGSHFLR